MAIPMSLSPVMYGAPRTDQMSVQEAYNRFYTLHYRCYGGLGDAGRLGGLGDAGLIPEPMSSAVRFYWDFYSTEMCHTTMGMRMGAKRGRKFEVINKIYSSHDWQWWWWVHVLFPESEIIKIRERAGIP